MRTQKSRGQSETSSSRKRLPRFSLRSRKKKEGVIKGKLRMRSVPGAFLVLGMVVVIVGMALAVAGYWPYRAQRSTLAAVGDGLLIPSQASEFGFESKGLFSTSSLVHSDRMKLLGPVIMGVGLFILICANTVLYENRDRETQMMLAQMQSVICTVSAAVPSADPTQMNSLIRHYQWVSSLPAAHLNILCLQELPSSEPLLPVSAVENDSVSHQTGVLHTEVLHHQDSSSTSSVHSSNSCNFSKVDFSAHPDSNEGASYGQDSQPKGQCLHSNCLTASSMCTLQRRDWELAAVSPKRAHSMSHRTNPHMTFRALGHLKEKTVQSTGCLRQLPRQCSSEVCVTMFGAGAETLDLGPVEGRRHRSWPWLDLGYAMRYLKLENKEDSVDTLLEQLEQQCSQLDRSFGSGPF